MTGGRAAAALGAATALAVLAWVPPAYRDAPPPAHTGGFGEPLCSECHFGAPVNAASGTVTIEGPASFRADTTYRLVVKLEHPEMAAAGFQLAVRFGDDSSDGRQAGTLRSAGPRTAVTADAATGVAYAHQTMDGAGPVRDGRTRWTLEWTAPAADGPVVVHVAANAANDDASEFGDRIFTDSLRIPRVDGPGGLVHLRVFETEPLTR